MGEINKISEDKKAFLPDYIGIWKEGPFNDNSFKGKFRIYIKERSPVSDDYELINGFLEDEYGRASFKGAISKSEILFHAKYIESHLDNYKNFETKYYSGIGTGKDIYIGNYGFKEDGNEGIVYCDEKIFYRKCSCA